jgi:hypothetical protein
MTPPAHPPIELHNVELVPERTLGEPPVGSLAGRLSFGWYVRPATADAVSPERRSILLPAKTYCHLVLVCTFRAETPDLPGVSRYAALGLSLRSGDGGDVDNDDSSPRPTARIVDPAELTRPARPGISSSTKVTLGLNPGPVNVGVEHTRNAADAEEWIVRGYGAHQPTPSWDFRRTKRYPLVGDYPVEAFIELVDGDENTADVLLSAELEHRRLGIRRYRGRLEPTIAAIPLRAEP